MTQSELPAARSSRPGTLQQAQQSPAGAACPGQPRLHGGMIAPQYFLFFPSGVFGQKEGGAVEVAGEIGQPVVGELRQEAGQHGRQVEQIEHGMGDDQVEGAPGTRSGGPSLRHGLPQKPGQFQPVRCISGRGAVPASATYSPVHRPRLQGSAGRAGGGRHRNRWPGRLPGRSAIPNRPFAPAWCRCRRRSQQCLRAHRSGGLRQGLAEFGPDVSIQRPVINGLLGGQVMGIKTRLGSIRRRRRQPSAGKIIRCHGHFPALRFLPVEPAR